MEGYLGQVHGSRSKVKVTRSKTIYCACLWDFPLDFKDASRRRYGISKITSSLQTAGVAVFQEESRRNGPASRIYLTPYMWMVGLRRWVFSKHMWFFC